MSRRLFIAAFILVPAMALAQAQPPVQTVPPIPVVSASPERTTASFGDWTLRCERPSLPAGATRVCEVAQSIQLQGQQGPLAQIAIGRLQRTDPLRLTLVLANNVTLTSVPKLGSEEKGGPTTDTVWQRCLPGGCFADVALKDDVLKRLRSKSEPARLEFRDAAGRDIILPVSLRGLAQALDALAKE
jgi:invasion protein IalB